MNRGGVKGSGRLKERGDGRKEEGRALKGERLFERGYRWVLFKGENGVRGVRGVRGAKRVKRDKRSKKGVKGRQKGSKKGVKKGVTRE